MSDEVERTCPLCAEEMDLTDQQLKPCKCGYEICVWCWHHIMDMAEKDDTDGRCPACRTAYDKEKIVGMAANCGRMMAEINSERRLKSQKAKSKASDGRKHLSSVRVIQRHLVYIIGLPNNLADEAILERKEYFGQYGKVLKVSITRPAGGSQHPSNTNTCSVYITYTKEEDAIRCIQSVHGFVLEGRSLRACFGTTKYCHTWLRNMPCNNPDCLYLHDMGTPEDSFTKDEIISAYTRVQQITGAANNSQRRSGNVLPPPADEFSNNIGSPPGKTLVKNASNVKVSPNGSSSVRSSVLPAAASWGQRVSSSCQQPAASMPCLQGPAKQKTDTLNSLSAFSSTTASEAVPSDLHNNGRKILMITKESDPMDLIGRSGMEATKYIGCQTADAHTKVFLDADYATMTDYTYTPPEDKDRGITMPPNFTHYENLDRQHSFGSGSTEVACGSIAVDEIIQSVSSRLSSIDIDNHLAIEGPDVSKHPSPISDKISTLLDGNPVGVRQHYPDYGNDIIEPLTSLPLRKAVMVSESSCVSIEKPNWYSELQTQVLSTASREMDDVLLHVDEQRLKLSEAATYPSCLPYSSNSLKAPHLYSGHLSQHFDTGNPSILDNADPGTVNIEVDTLRPFGGSVLSNGHDKNKFSSYGSGNRVGCSDMISNTEKVRCLERFNGDASEVDRIAGIDIGESSIISNILSLDYDSLDDSLNSPRGLAKLFGETDKQNGSLKLSSSWKPQNSNQSRFSFARQEDFVNQATHLEPTLRNSGYVQKKKFDLQDSVENKDTSQDKLRDGFTCNGVEISESLINGLVPSNKVAVSRSQKSAPPGFSVPSRLPPPGFSSQESADRSFVSVSSGNQLLGSPLLRKQYQAPSTVNMGDSFGDVEFIDPAILAVGKGAPPLVTSNSGLDLASTYPAQLNFSEYDSRLRLLMQQSFSTHQNFRVSEHMTDHFSPLNDSYISSSLVEPTQGNSPSHLAHMSFPQSRNLQMSNGQWDGRNGVQASNDVALSEIVRNELLGFTNYFPGHEESKFHIPSSGNLYNRAFGM